MLDAASPLAVAGAEVLAWADLDSPDLVWALPVRPRLAMTPDGQPDASLLLYRRGAGSPPDGGQLSLTVDLALTAAEAKAAARAGEDRRPPPPPGEPQPPPVQVRAPQWVDAAVRAELVDGVAAEGRPSLLGDNPCVLALQLDAAQAAAVDQAWAAGFPDATVELDGSVEGGTSASARATAAMTAQTAQTTPATQADPAEHAYTEATTAFAVAAGARNAVRVPLQLRGPLRLPSHARSARRTDITL